MKDGGEYVRRQIVRDNQHAQNYRTWVQSLTPAEQEKLRQLGIEEPDTSYHGNGMSERDLADSPLASEEPDIIAQIEPEPKPATSIAEDVDERVMDVLRRLLGEVLTQRNAKLTLECVAISCGLATLQGESMTSIARRHGISRAAVSKRCVDIAEKLGLPPSRSMRSKTARKAYREAQTELRNRHERTSN